jgi:hypothetical protein
VKNFFRKKNPDKKENLEKKEQKPGKNPKKFFKFLNPQFKYLNPQFLARVFCRGQPGEKRETRTKSLNRDFNP